MVRILSLGLSYIFHPVFVPFYLLLFCFSANTYLAYYPLSAKSTMLGISFISSVLMPLGFLPFLKILKIISSYEISDNRERIIPIFLTSVCLLATYYIFKFLNFYVDNFIQIFLLASSLTGLVALAITYWWKISLHMIAMGSSTGILAAISYHFYTSVFWLLITQLIIAALVAGARLSLGSHTKSQVYSGYVLGLVIMILVMLVY